MIRDRNETHLSAVGGRKGRRAGAWFVALALLVSLSRPASAKEPAPLGQGVVIDRIEITGFKVFPASEIEASIEIAAGDKVRRDEMQRTADNLKNLYRTRGYDAMEVKARIFKDRAEQGGGLETVLGFEISEGSPTRIASILFVPESVRDERFQKIWRRLEGSLRDRSPVAVGDVFDQDRISSGRKALLDVLSVDEFIGGRVDDLRVFPATAPEKVGGGAPGPASRWVSLEFHIDVGDRVSFGFRGHSAFSTQYLLTLIEEQRQLGLGRDYIGAIQARILEEYRSLGYSHPRIDVFTFEQPQRQERHVTFAIDEGVRVDLDRISFDGNSVFTVEELRDKLMSLSSPVVQHGYYVDKEIQKAAQQLIDWMKSRGYLGAKLIAVNTNFFQKMRSRDPQSAVQLMIYLYEGDQTVVQGVHLDGVTAIPPDEVKRSLGVRENEPLNLFALTDGIEALKALYRARGYLDVKVLNENTERLVKYRNENRFAEIHLEVAEGPQFRVSQVQIEGLDKTKPGVVEREVRLKEGQVLEESLLAENEARIRRLGIFGVVNLATLDEPGRPGYKRVKITVQEGTPGVVAGGLGLRNDLGLRVFGQTAYTNIGGKNHTILLNTNANRRFERYRFLEYQAQLAYLWPYFMLGPTLFRPTITVSGTQYIYFDATTIALALIWERKLIEKPNLTFLFNYSLERVNQFNARENVDNQTLRIGSVTPTLRLDMRNDPLSPSSGFFGSASCEIADPAFFSQNDPFPVGYTRFQMRTDYFLPLFKDMVWYLSFRSGYERNTQKPVNEPGKSTLNQRSGSIPLIKQFALGGISSLRGFGEQDLNLQDKQIRGTAAYVNYRTEVAIPISGPLKVAPFFDAANLLVDDFSFVRGVRMGVGAGIRYLTPVGPVNFDWGFKIRPRRNPQTGVEEEPYRFYFSIGII